MCSFDIVRCDRAVHLFRCFIVIWLYFAFTNGLPQSEKVKKIDYRLPNNTRPTKYDITLATNIDQNDFNFMGRVAIKLEVMNPTYNITIHARQLTIKSISLATQAGVPILLKPHIYDNVTEFLVIHTKAELQKDRQYLLIVMYTGVLRTDRMGFYRASYVNANGETKKVLLSILSLRHFIT